MSILKDYEQRMVNSISLLRSTAIYMINHARRLYKRCVLIRNKIKGSSWLDSLKLRGELSYAIKKLEDWVNA